MSGRTLVISPNWIGDAVMAQPLLQRLKQQHPGRPIDVLAPPAVAPVWRAAPEVDTVLETPFRHKALQLRERWKYAQVLRARGYVDAYVLPNTLKYALIPWLAGIRRRVGYKGEMRYGLVNVMHHDDAPPRPMVPFYAALALAPDAPLAPAPRPRLQVAGERIAAACARLGIDSARPLVVFAPGAEFGPAKRWPPRHFGALAQAILTQHGDAQIALLGSPKDRETGDEVLAAAGAAAASMRNLAGETKLDEAFALIARAAAVVANDSGLLHVASSLNRPVIALYGPTDPDHAPPFSDIARALSLRIDCAPCRQRECPLGHHDCMEKMEAPLVWKALAPMLAR
ncbi:MULTISPECIES: lipopolysaccharide heptosyltransferase II [unclassified Massilia]|uniref:lipopolysaccharide heptosyltransferase II n=1 Tax=unclassified Massilia TaxID=2609279 RepID=UPI00177EF2DD|nr:MULTISPECIES: lipopolysaccharide heptosyltransferase II [unclassified Massilia]MBD8529885.1 lipopolysaccharide heptosyltransferase II [Massilia sp. CFBP 13647]MBD8672103.1 lipopolysaccharide heptosyltransferase II [Massilia sp. CFBP 13721]